MKPSFALEICCDSITSVRAAVEGGATRIELCQALGIGGITPSFGLIKRVRSLYPSLDVMVLIRCRGGDFFYDDDEIEVMQSDIRQCASLGVYGVVIGCLTSSSQLHIPHLKSLISVGHDECHLAITIHRAFDLVPNQVDALLLLERHFDKEISWILTSGGASSVTDALPQIQKLVVASSNPSRILCGAGIRAHNLPSLTSLFISLSSSLSFPSPVFFHLSAQTKFTSPASCPSPHLNFGLIENNHFIRQATNSSTVKKCFTLLQTTSP